MFPQIMQFLGDGVSAVLQWFDMLLDSIGMRGFLMAFIFMALVFRFLILPFSGSGGVGQSDKVIDNARNSGLFSNPDAQKKSSSKKK